MKNKPDLSYSFNDENILMEALTHSSTEKKTNDGRLFNNERLEFLGDAVIDLVISEELLQRMKEKKEGHLTKLRAGLVCSDSLADLATDLKLGEYVLLSYGEEKSGARTRKSLLSDVMEAVVGAIYLDGGFEAAKKFVLDIFNEKLELAVKGQLQPDYKTKLQELLQEKGITDIRYNVENETGPDHDKLFYISVSYDGKKIGNGIGKSKKAAQQAAAKMVLELEETDIVF